VSDPLVDYESGATWANEKPFDLRGAAFGIGGRAYRAASELAPPGPFPTVEDFRVVVKPTDVFGVHLFFWSPSLGVLSRFPHWDHLERGAPYGATGDSDWTPVGTAAKPFMDCDQGWIHESWRDGGFVYVLHGDDCATTGYATWFRVGEPLFDQEWHRARTEARQLK